MGTHKREFIELKSCKGECRVNHITNCFDFLEIHYQRRNSNIRKPETTRIYPSQKSMEKFRQKLKDLANLTKTHVKSTDALIGEINAIISEYTNYFNHTKATLQYKSLYRFVEWRVSKFYCHLHYILRTSYKGTYIGICRTSGLMQMIRKISFT